VLNFVQRFTGVDPLAGKFAGHSPYNYVMGNPISIVDPNGAEAVYVDGVRQEGYEADVWKGKAAAFTEKGDPTIEALRGAFRVANQKLLKLGVGQNVIDAGNTAFDKMIESFIQGDAKMIAELQVTFGLRTARTTRWKTLTSLVKTKNKALAFLGGFISAGKASYDLNLGSIEYWTGKYEADVSLSLMNRNIVKNGSNLEFTGISTGTTTNLSFGARLAASFIGVFGVGGEISHIVPPSGFQDATTTVSIGSFDYSVNRKTRQVVISSNFQMDIRYGAGLVGSAKGTLQYSGSVGY